MLFISSWGLVSPLASLALSLIFSLVDGGATTNMTAIDWWWTGRNNATDLPFCKKNRLVPRRGFWCPSRKYGASFMDQCFYTVGWVYGKISPNARA
jgi:hypothetical protein